MKQALEQNMPDCLTTAIRLRSAETPLNDVIFPPVQENFFLLPSPQSIIMGN